MLSKKAKDDLATIYKEEFGESLTDDQIEEMGMRLLRLFTILAQGNASEDRS